MSTHRHPKAKPLNLPPQSEWKRYALALLSSTEKQSVTSCKKDVQKSLDILRSRASHGRDVMDKSQFQEVLRFYEYLIQSLENESVNASTTIEQHEDRQQVAPLVTGHSDECAICDKEGELVCCSTCTFACHLACIRPQIKVVPKGDWSCSFCHVAGIQVVKRGRRMSLPNAKNGIRDMRDLAKLAGKEKEFDKFESMEREQLFQINNEGEEIADNNEIDRCALESISVHSEQSDSVKKRSLGEISDDSRENSSLNLQKLNNIPVNEHRSKRVRKQPTLYDPQTGPASEWKTDGAAEWRYMSKFNCSFCEDDDSVSVCPFCACKVCFGKHDEESIILCDSCDDEYHVHCLNPPLRKVPSRNDWFCSSCKSKRNENKTSSPKEQVQTPKSSDSSKKKRSTVIVSDNEQKNEKDTSRSTVECPPSKFNLVTKTNISLEYDDDTKNTKKCKDTHTINIEKSIAKECAGKTLVDVNNIAPPLLEEKNNQGERNNDGYDKNDNNLNVSPLQSNDEKIKDHNQPLRSRSGRVVKKKSFLIEEEEREQHLKSDCKAPVLTNNLDSVDEKSISSLMPSVEKVTPFASVSMSSEKTTNQSHELKLATPVPTSEANMHSNLSETKETPNSSLNSTRCNEKMLQLSRDEDFDDSIVPGGTIDSVENINETFDKEQPQSTVLYLSPITGQPLSKEPRRKPGARECMQISRRFGVNVIPKKYIDVLADYCSRGKLEHLIRMRERLDDHSKFLEYQLAAFEDRVREKQKSDQIKTPQSVDKSGP